MFDCYLCVLFLTFVVFECCFDDCLIYCLLAVCCCLAVRFVVIDVCCSFVIELNVLVLIGCYGLCVFVYQFVI